MADYLDVFTLSNPAATVACLPQPTPLSYEQVSPCPSREIEANIVSVSGVSVVADSSPGTSLVTVNPFEVVPSRHESCRKLVHDDSSITLQEELAHEACNDERKRDFLPSPLSTAELGSLEYEDDQITSL